VPASPIHILESVILDNPGRTSTTNGITTASCWCWPASPYCSSRFGRGLL